MEAATELVLGQGLCMIGIQLRASDHFLPLCWSCELSHSWVNVRYVCPPPHPRCTVWAEKHHLCQFKEVVRGGSESTGRGPGVQLL